MYSTYHSPKDNVTGQDRADVQQCYIMTSFPYSCSRFAFIPLMQGVSNELMKVNTCDDIKRWWGGRGPYCQPCDATAGLEL